MQFHLKHMPFSPLGSRDQFFREDNKEEIKKTKCVCVFALSEGEKLCWEMNADCWKQMAASSPACQS